MVLPDFGKVPPQSPASPAGPATSLTCAPPPARLGGSSAVAVWAAALGVASLLPPLALITGPIAVTLGTVSLVERCPRRAMSVVGIVIGGLAWFATLMLMLQTFVWGPGPLGAMLIGLEGGVTRKDAVGVYVARYPFATEILQLFEDGTYAQTIVVDYDRVPRYNKNCWSLRLKRGDRGDVDLKDAIQIASPIDNQGRINPRWGIEAPRPGWWEVRPGICTLAGTKGLGRFGGRIALDNDEDAGLIYRKVSQ